MRRNACCFTGHRMISNADADVLRTALREEISRLYVQGVTEFYAGGAQGFDMLAEEAVLEMRESLPIRLHLILPCQDQDARWPQSLRLRFARIKEAADTVRYITDVYDASCMHLRNNALVEASAYCICYMQRERGGTVYTVRRARRAGLEIIHLMTTEPEQLRLTLPEDMIDTEEIPPEV